MTQVDRRLARMLGEVAGKLDRGEQVDPQLHIVVLSRAIKLCQQHARQAGQKLQGVELSIADADAIHGLADSFVQTLTALLEADERYRATGEAGSICRSSR